MAHSHEKVGGCSRTSCLFTCLTVDHATAQIEVVIDWLLVGFLICGEISGSLKKNRLEKLASPVKRSA